MPQSRQSDRPLAIRRSEESEPGRPYHRNLNCCSGRPTNRPTSRPPDSRKFRLEGNMRANDLAIDPTRLNGFEAAVKPDGGLDTAVPEQPAHDFILAGTMLEEDCGGCMPKLMHADAEPN